MRSDYFSGPVIVLRFEQMPHCLLPRATFQKILGKTLVLSGHPGKAQIRAQPAAQKTLKQRVQSILFAGAVCSNRDEDIPS